ncbi:MAG: hypothetical protein R3E79_02750 [Caldilineaceae bacterium]
MPTPTARTAAAGITIASHRPLTGIFLCRRPILATILPTGNVSSSPDGDFFMPTGQYGNGLELNSLVIVP